MYSKLYSKILISSVWMEDMPTRLLWITLLALSDREGYVFGSITGLASIARLPPKSAADSMEKLTAPDPASSDLMENPDNEGRRVEVIPGGWLIINYTKYRDIKDAEERRKQNREAKQRQREREKSAAVSKGQH